MTDVYVYYFRYTASAGKSVISHRRATLETIQDLGEAVMETQLVVDQSELDSKGFVMGHADANCHPMDALWGEIRSLELRARARDNEALFLEDSSDGAAIYMLSQESRELRKQSET